MYPLHKEQDWYISFLDLPWNRYRLKPDRDLARIIATINGEERLHDGSVTSNQWKPYPVMVLKEEPLWELPSLGREAVVPFQEKDVLVLACQQQLELLEVGERLVALAELVELVLALVSVLVLVRIEALVAVLALVRTEALVRALVLASLQQGEMEEKVVAPLRPSQVHLFPLEVLWCREVQQPLDLRVLSKTRELRVCLLELLLKQEPLDLQEVFVESSNQVLERVLEVLH